jgi:hypothetical protein
VIAWQNREVGRYGIKREKRQQYFAAVRAGMDENRVSIVDELSGQSQ